MTASSKNNDEDNYLDASSAPLMDHIIELRRRLVWAVFALIICFAISFYYAEIIYNFLTSPLDSAFGDTEAELIFTKLQEPFFVKVKVAMFAAFFLAFPILAGQLYAFVAPGLYKREKRAFLPFLLATPVLFIAGAALAYYAVMPAAFAFFLHYEGNFGGVNLKALPSVSEYLSLVMQFILAFGIFFQLPILLLLLNRAGIVSREQLKSYRRFMIVGAFLLAAIFTPPDPFSQVMLAIPLLLLYEISIVIIYFTEKKQKQSSALME